MIPAGARTAVWVEFDVTVLHHWPKDCLGYCCPGCIMVLRKGSSQMVRGKLIHTPFLQNIYEVGEGLYQCLLPQPSSFKGQLCSPCRMSFGSTEVLTAFGLTGS